MKTNTTTRQDFINAGYSSKRADELVNSPAHNWKATNGGKRASVKLGFSESIKHGETLK